MKELATKKELYDALTSTKSELRVEIRELRAEMHASFEEIRKDFKEMLFEVMENQTATLMRHIGAIREGIQDELQMFKEALAIVYERHDRHVEANEAEHGRFKQDILALKLR